MTKKRRSNSIISIIAALLLASVTFAWMKNKGKNKKKDSKPKEQTEQNRPDFSHFSKEWVDFIEKEYKMLYHHWQQEESRFKRTLKHLHDLFIPHSGNEHKPKALSAKWLKFYAIALITIKLLVVGFLFFTYPNPAKLSQQVADELFELTNQSRAELGLPELAYNETLAQAAQAKANDMVSKGYFAHIGPDGKKPWEWIDRGSYPFVYMGENLAMDFTTAEVIHLAFKKSPSHWKNVTNPKYRDIGIGVATGVINGRETTVLVQFFGGRQALGPQLAAATTDTNKVDQAVEPPVTARQQETDSQTEQVTQVAGVEKDNSNNKTDISGTAQPEERATVESEQSQDSTATNKPSSSQSKVDEQDQAKAETKTNKEPIADTPVKQPTEVKVVKAGVAQVGFVGESVDNQPALDLTGQEQSENDNTSQSSQKLAKEYLPPPQFDSSDRLVVATITSADRNLSLVDYVILFSRYFFLVFMVVMFILLIINILVHPHIQHGHVIMQTIAIIVLSGALLLTRFHILENLPRVIIY